MIEFINLLQSIGDWTLEYILFPLLIWTVIALPISLLLRRLDSIPPVYQYHSSVGLLLVLPLSIAGTYIFDLIPTASESAGTAKFLVIQNPVTVSTSSTGSTAFSIADPLLWIGILSLIIAGGALVLLFKMLINFAKLKTMEGNLQFKPLSQCSELVSNLPEMSNITGKTLVSYSSDTNIPYTYGWWQTKIVLPADLKKDADALAMAVQHELMHIKHRDFLLNGLLLFIKSLFWFHPLTHYLYSRGTEYREITCDGEVLASNQFSKKRYASLLVELAQKEHHPNLAMSMAVHPSSLKKRIQVISNSNDNTMSFRPSFLLTFFAVSLLTLTISCTDMAEDGITKSEVEATQSQLAKTSPENPNAPLYFVNGEQLKSNAENNSTLARLKPKYIKSIKVLKGEQATNKYGKKGKNGVFEIQLLDGINQKTAFSDLKESPTNVPPLPPKKKDHYVAVEDMPKLIGGLASLQKKINYPEEAQSSGVEGRVIIQFIVNKKGEVENPQVIRGIGGGADEEALRVVKQAEFTPGKQHGEPVRVQYSLPITYKLAQNGS